MQLHDPPPKRLNNVAGQYVLAVGWEVTSLLSYLGLPLCCLGFLSAWQLGSQEGVKAADSFKIGKSHISILLVRSAVCLAQIQRGEERDPTSSTGFDKAFATIFNLAQKSQNKSHA